MNSTESLDGDAGAGQALAALGLGTGVLCEALLGWIDRTGTPLSIKEVASGRYLHVNRAMAELLGRPPAEVVGLTDADFDPKNKDYKFP